MNPIHHAASSLGPAQTLIILSVFTLVTYRNTILKLLLITGIALVIAVFVSGTVTLLSEFR